MLRAVRAPLQWQRSACVTSSYSGETRGRLQTLAYRPCENRRRFILGQTHCATLTVLAHAVEHSCIICRDEYISLHVTEVQVATQCILHVSVASRSAPLQRSTTVQLFGVFHDAGYWHIVTPTSIVAHREHHVESLHIFLRCGPDPSSNTSSTPTERRYEGLQRRLVSAIIMKIEMIDDTTEPVMPKASLSGWAGLVRLKI
ncbi:uncharacterized protein B0H18DRAFT_1033878 [Fomitopsis serialis]|uniref:uncharacterized protein n=1 Tax=Fomitopsis serialis TaxID=139415 RepID=UPI0020085241|nr:uncharacterized protein B0H18DRAFT_1033878 [Neoantrodia serialis]KAH9917599.1 hypothetical protein B0H18DRAFT_1033878 [Neoantrodia serialis]